MLLDASIPTGTGVDQKTDVRFWALVVATCVSALALSGFWSVTVKPGVPQFHHSVPLLLVCWMPR